MRENEIAADIVDAAFKIHSSVGPGCLEKVYELLLAHELRKRGHHVETQVSVAIVYDELVVPDAMKIDLVVDDLVIVELKAVEELHDVCFKQVLTYLKFAKKRLGLLINFNCPRIKMGIHRLVNGLPDSK